MSEKSRGKQKADPTVDVDLEKGHPGSYLPHESESSRKSGNGAAEEGRSAEQQGSGSGAKSAGRHVTVVFSNESESGGGNLELWVEDGESVGSVKDQIRHLRPTLAPLSLRLIHAGRLLTDGVLLLPWLRSLEERVRRQTGGVGGDVESVLREVGLQDEDEDDARRDDKGDRDATRHTSRGNSKGKEKEKERAWLHCNVGPTMEDDKGKAKDEGDEASLFAPPRSLTL